MLDVVYMRSLIPTVQYCTLKTWLRMCSVLPGQRMHIRRVVSALQAFNFNFSLMREWEMWTVLMRPLNCILPSSLKVYLWRTLIWESIDLAAYNHDLYILSVLVGPLSNHFAAILSPIDRLLCSCGCHGDVHRPDVLLVVCVLCIVCVSILALPTTAPQKVSVIVLCSEWYILCDFPPLAVISMDHGMKLQYKVNVIPWGYYYLDSIIIGASPTQIMRREIR